MVKSERNWAQTVKVKRKEMYWQVKNLLSSKTVFFQQKKLIKKQAKICIKFWPVFYDLHRKE